MIEPRSLIRHDVAYFRVFVVVAAVCAGVFFRAVLRGGARHPDVANINMALVGLSGAAVIACGYLALKLPAIRSRWARRECVQCGYSLVGLREQPCPECGAEQGSRD